MDKKNLYPWILLVILLGVPVVCYPQKIENVVSEISDNKIHIYYDLLGIADDEPVIIRAFVSTDGGQSYGEPLKSVSGDVGVVIGGGARKLIIWDVFEEVDELVSESVTFKVKADLLQSNKDSKFIETGYLINMNANLGSKVQLGSYGFNLKAAIYLNQVGLGVRGGYYKTFGENPDDIDFDCYVGFSGGAVIEYDFIRDPRYSIYPFFYIGQTKIQQNYKSITDKLFEYSIFYSPGLGLDIKIAKFIYLGIELEYYMSPYFAIDDQGGSNPADEIAMDGFCAGVTLKFFMQPDK